MWQWLGLGRKTDFLDNVLASVRLHDSSPDDGVVVGSPPGELDPAALVSAVRTQAARMDDRREFVFQARLPSWNAHAYASMKDVTPTLEELRKCGVGEARYATAAASPRAFLASWLLSFPFTAKVEDLASSATVMRLMGADPIVAQDYRLSKVTRRDDGSPEATLVLSAQNLPQALDAGSVPMVGGALVMGFTVRACWDLDGLSHAVIGTIFHYRVVDFEHALPRIHEVRASVGGGSVTGGLPDNMMAFYLWLEQTGTIERMLVDRRFYAFLDDLEAEQRTRRRLEMLDEARTRFSKKPAALAVLNPLMMPYRFVQRFMPSARQGEPVGGPYRIKEVKRTAPAPH